MIIPEDYGQVNFRWTWTATGQIAECALGIQLPVSLPDPASLATTIAGIYVSTNMATVQAAQVSLTNIHVKYGPNSTGASADHPTGVPGTLTGDTIPPNTALLIKKGTSFGGRHGKGRMYWPGIQDGVVDSYGLVTTSALGTFQTKFDAFRAAFNAADIDWVVLHGSDTPVPYLVNSLVCRQKVGTQRRRLGT